MSSVAYPGIPVCRLWKEEQTVRQSRRNHQKGERSDRSPGNGRVMQQYPRDDAAAKQYVIALSQHWKRSKSRELLDVFQTVKSLRMQRPHMSRLVGQVQMDLLRKHHQSLHQEQSHLSPQDTSPGPRVEIRSRGPIKAHEQYDFCYKVVQDFVDIFSDYANFK
ncbi:hypothetical protein WMY93_010142 [Mugilogobius chulae]|uniref:Uncharacterized protein n=1 Tax=Mugilogobius chulae TaxID=88201 RepID=A0AAW0PIW9_9GOBI